MKKPQVKDASTGKTFALGNSGNKALAERIRAYANGQHQQLGVQMVEVLPKTLKLGSKFKCSACAETFTFKKGMVVEEFYDTIRAHGRGHGVCEILPVNLK
jgi:hypothetical protein